ncbi:hypothetical protein BH20CHL6_BH20CHL6_02480 [soil metagenome]
MDHADARQRLAEAFIEPSRLFSLTMGTGTADAELRDHLAGCESCGVEYDALEGTRRLLIAAAPDDMTAPAPARARVLATVSATGTIRRAEAQHAIRRVEAAPRGRLRSFAPALLAAATAIALVVTSAVSLRLVEQRDRDAQELRSLSAVAAATDRLLRQPDHQLAVLRLDGKPAGSVLADPVSGEIMVVSDALDPGSEAPVYRCFMERDGVQEPVGEMHFAGSLAFWVGPVPSIVETGTHSMTGQRFVIRAGSATGDVILVGEF